MEISDSKEYVEFSEFPNVEDGVDRKLVFSEIIWLRKIKFEKMVQDYMNKNTIVLNVYPCLNEELDIDNRVFIGKTIPKSPPLSINGNEVNSTGSSTYEFLEIIGSVYKQSNERGNKWKLRITHEDRIYDIDNDFLVLQIKDKNSFYWSSNKDAGFSFFNNTKMPKYALRAAVDKIDCKYSYIGRTLNENDIYLSEKIPKRPKYYMNAWFYFDENIPQIFGKINRTYKLLFAPYKNLEIGFDEFETLCMKASPAPLKILCRSVLRKYLNYSQQNIKSINSTGNFNIPSALIDYLKYPSSLKSGEFMLKDEKLVKEDDDNYELIIDQNTGNLVCRSSKSKEEVKNEKLLAYNIDTIWLHRFQTVFYNQVNSTAFTAHSLSDNLASYKFFIEWDKLLSQVIPL